MNRSRIALATLVLGGASLVAPAVASADPIIAAESGGAVVPTDGTSGTAGQQVLVSGTGCTSPTPGAPTYMGEYVTFGADPLANPNTKVFETQTEADGSFSWDITIPVETPPGRYMARWFCASGPVSSIDDPAMLWVSPIMWMDVAAPAPAARMATASTSSSIQLRTSATSAASVSASTSGGSVRLKTDPEALPAVDRIGITGDRAAKLKAEVDAKAAATNATQNRNRAKRGQAPIPITPTAYVTAAFEVTHGRAPAASVMAPYVARVQAKQLKVGVVEDIALRKHSALWWNKR